MFTESLALPLSEALVHVANLLLDPLILINNDVKVQVDILLVDLMISFLNCRMLIRLYYIKVQAGAGDFSRLLMTLVQ